MKTKRKKPKTPTRKPLKASAFTRKCGGCRATLPLGEMREERDGPQNVKHFCSACVCRRMTAPDTRGPVPAGQAERVELYRRRAAKKLPLFA